MNPTQRSIGIVVLVVVVLGVLGYLFFSPSRGTDSNEVNQEEAATILAEIGAIMVLPDDETPTIATVTDPEALRGQPFYDKIKRGDVVLIYPNARRAILYDPAAKKILDVVPLAPVLPPPGVEAQ